MKKSLLLICFIVCTFPSITIYSMDSSYEENHNQVPDSYKALSQDELDMYEEDFDEDSSFDSQDENEKQQFFKKNVLEIRKTGAGRCLFLAGFFAEVQNLFKELEHNSGGFGHADMMANSARISVFMQLSRETSLKRLLQEVLDPVICTQEFSDQLIAQIIEQAKNLFDEGEKFFEKINIEEDSHYKVSLDTLMTFCEQAMIAIFSRFPEHDLEKFTTAAGQVLCFENLLMNSYQKLMGNDNNLESLSEKFDRASFLYNVDSFKEKLSKIFADDGFCDRIDLITKDFAEMKNEKFKEFVHEDIQKLDDEKKEIFIKIAGDISRTWIDTFLAGFGAMEALRSFKPYFQCFM